MTNVSNVQGKKIPNLKAAAPIVQASTMTKPDELSAKLRNATPEPKVNETIISTKEGAVKITRDDNGQVKSEEVLSAQGQVVRRIIYSEGKKTIQDLDSDGKISHMTKFDTSGQKSLETSFKDGYPSIIVEYDENGNKKLATTYSDWNQKASETLYENDKKTTERFYAPDSGLIKETHYKDGVLTDSKDYKFGVHIDGEIGNFKQGTTGDCWAVGGIKSLALTEEGAKMIKESISQDEKTGNVTVELKGVGETYTFTPAEIKKRNFDLSSGDDDVRVLEMAIEGHRKKLQAASPDGNFKKNVSVGILEDCKDQDDAEKICAIQKKRPLTGGYEQEVWYDITGKTGNQVKAEDLSKALEEIQRNPSRKAVGLAFERDNGVKASGFVSSDPNFKLLLNHEYTIKKVDDQNVTVINPNDTSKEEIISREQFLKQQPTVSLLDLTKA